MLDHQPGMNFTTESTYLYFFLTISDTTKEAAIACESANIVLAAAVMGLWPFVVPGVGPGVAGVDILIL